MKTILLFIAAATLTGCAAIGEKNESFTVMTYNVRHCAGMDLKLNIEETANVIKSQSPRFVALQEIDSKTKRAQGVDQAAKLGELTGMFHVFGPTINFQGGKYGIAILSKGKPISTEQHPLPPYKGETRTILITEFEDVYFASTHWVHNNAKLRYDSVKIIEKIAAEKKDKPFILCGDFNATVDSSEMKEFKKAFTILSPVNIRSYHGNAVAGPSGTVNDFCIDYICVDKAGTEKIKVLSTSVIDDSKTSDHKPIIAEIQHK